MANAAAGQLGGLLVGAGGVVVLGADVDAAVVDDLAVGLLLGLAGEDPPVREPHHTTCTRRIFCLGAVND